MLRPVHYDPAPFAVVLDDQDTPTFAVVDALGFPLPLAEVETPRQAIQAAVALNGTGEATVYVVHNPTFPLGMDDSCPF